MHQRKTDQTSYLLNYLWGVFIPSSCPIFQGCYDFINFLYGNIREEMLFTRESRIKCSGDMFWDEIFLARFGPMFTKKSLNLELMVALSVMHDPLFNSNLEFTWHVLLLFTIFLKYLPSSLSCVYFVPKYPENAFFQHIIEYGLVYYDIFCI